MCYATCILTGLEAEVFLLVPIHWSFSVCCGILCLLSWKICLKQLIVLKEEEERQYRMYSEEDGFWS